MRELLECNPVISALKKDDDIEKVIESDCNIVFILSGDILTLKERVKKLKDNEKIVFVHVDMINGISNNPIVIKYLNEEMNIDGIITTKINLVKAAIDEGIKVIQRVFLLDSMSLESTIDHLKKVRPTAIEIMPGIITKIVDRIHSEFPYLPIICGGLIDNKHEIIEALKNGAMAVSTTKTDLW